MPFCAYQNDFITDFADIMSAVVKRIDYILSLLFSEYLGPVVQN